MYRAREVVFLPIRVYFYVSNKSENVKELLGQVKKVASELDASFETMVIEAFGMDETAASIQEASWKIKWTLDRIDLALERMNETKYTVQLDDKSVLTVNDLHRELISDQKLALEEYKKALPVRRNAGSAHRQG